MERERDGGRGIERVGEREMGKRNRESWRERDGGRGIERVGERERWGKRNRESWRERETGEEE